MKILNNIALSDTGFVFNPNTGESFTLNPAGMEIFEMLRQEKNNEEILGSILEKYDVDQDMAEKDLDDFMHHLETYQIIETDE
jgi:PqqD family protein of HPr-rel-A system